MKYRKQKYLLIVSTFLDINDEMFLRAEFYLKRDFMWQVDHKGLHYVVV